MLPFFVENKKGEVFRVLGIIEAKNKMVYHLMSTNEGEIFFEENIRKYKFRSFVNLNGGIGDV